MNDLKTKIANRETELQRAYDGAMSEAKKWIAIKIDAEKHIRESVELIERCRERAREQNCTEIL